jgi:hypothetical protein
MLLSALDTLTAPCPSQGDAYSHDSIKHPEPVFFGMLMDDHVASYLGHVEVVIPDLQQTDYLITDDMEDEDG